MAKNGNVEVQGLSRFTAVQDLFVSGTLTTSGSVSLGAAVFDVDSHLELSSSAGSIVAISASMDFPNTDKLYHIRARNSHLIFSSSTGSTVTISGGLKVTDILGGTTSNVISIPTGGRISSPAGRMAFGFQSVDGTVFFVNSTESATIRMNTVTGIIDHLSQHLILSGTGGSVVALSSNLYFPIQAPANSAHIVSRNSHLILSSSAGSVITLSGALYVLNGSTLSGTTAIDAAGTLALPNLTDNSVNGWITSVGRSLLGMTSTNNTLLNASSAANGTFKFVQGGVEGNVLLSISNTGSISIYSGSIAHAETHLILSSSKGSVVAFSSSQDFPNSDKAYHIRAVNSHLILSSSAGGVVAMSGTGIKLPAPSGRGFTLISSNGFAINGLDIRDEAGNQGVNAVNAGAWICSNGGGSFQSYFGRGGIGNATALGNGAIITNTDVVKWTGGAAMAGASVAALIIGRHDSGSLYISGSGGTNMIVAKEGHLILSSSVGSIVAISGGFSVKAGSLYEDIQTITTSRTLSANDSYVLCDATNASFNLYLPTPVQGRLYKLKKIAGGGNNITITGSASENIDGASTYLLDTANESIVVIASGTAWYVF